MGYDFQGRARSGNATQIRAWGSFAKCRGTPPGACLITINPLLKQNEWQRFPQIALDFVLVSPYTAVAIGRQSPNPTGVVAVYTETKWQDKEKEMIYF